MGALVDVPIQEIAQTTLKNQSAIDAVNLPNNGNAAPQSTRPSLAIPLLFALAIGACLV